MKAFSLAFLGLVCAGSVAFASSVAHPVALPSKACCETCTVARWAPPIVPPVPASMIWSALFLEAGLLAAAVLGLSLVARPRPTTDVAAQPARPTPAEV